MSVPTRDGRSSAATEPKPESDETGFTIENRLGGTHAPNYRQWEIDTVAPHCGSSVLEVGSGMGWFSEKLHELGLQRLVLSDLEDYTLGKLREKYAGDDHVDVIKVALPGHIDVGERVETVVAMNVLEHIEDDVAALRSLSDALVPGGRIVLWVPAYQALYGEFDRKVGHFRRYTPKTMRAVVDAAGLNIQEIRPINLLGGIAWWLAVRRKGVGAPNPKLVWLYDRLVVPAGRAVERLARPPFGQSVVCVARKPVH
ncbi:MAG: class I SAM-dependent methyltransferase [Mycobacteriales bacterium]